MTPPSCPRWGAAGALGRRGAGLRAHFRGHRRNTPGIVGARATRDRQKVHWADHSCPAAGRATPAAGLVRARVLPPGKCSCRPQLTAWPTVRIEVAQARRSREWRAVRRLRPAWLAKRRRVLCGPCARAEWREQTSVPDRTRREALSYAEAWDQAAVAFMTALSVVVCPACPAPGPVLARTMRARAALRH